MKKKFWIGSLALVAAALLFTQVGNFLVVEDRFDRAELAVVLSGGAVERSLAARDLYRQGRISRILVIPEPRDPVVARELTTIGLLDPGMPPTSVRVLAASGVPPSAITLLKDPVEGTIGEALAVRKFLNRAYPRSVVVVTSKMASRRARFLFRGIFGREGVQVYSYPTPYDPFVPQRWWSPPRNILLVTMECEKFLANLLMLPVVQWRGQTR